MHGCVRSASDCQSLHARFVGFGIWTVVLLRRQTFFFARPWPSCLRVCASSLTRFMYAGRRRKIKCNYPPTPPSSPSTAAELEKKCIECSPQKRTCQIQGFVAVETSPDPQLDKYATNGDTTSKPKQSQKPRIYKRRRPMDRSSSCESGDV